MSGIARDGGLEKGGLCDKNLCTVKSAKPLLARIWTSSEDRELGMLITVETGTGQEGLYTCRIRWPFLNVVVCEGGD